MAIAVKMDEETKSRLEALQAEVKSKTGKKVTQQEILSRFVDSAVESRSEFVDRFRDSKTALDDAAIERFNAGMIASGEETAEADVDEILYG